MKLSKTLLSIIAITYFINIITFQAFATPKCEIIESKEKSIDLSQKQKVIYLTFDDGPTKKNTPKVLEILEREKVPATFFLIGSNVDKYKETVLQLKEHNMAIGAHSYSHVTGQIYKSAYNYKADLKKCIEVIKNVVGEDLINITRMPCGSTNRITSPYIKKQIKNAIRSLDLNYIDWNVSGEDAISRNIPTSVIWKNIVKDSKDKDVIVLLLHDGYYNSTTVEILPKVIEHFKKEGYTFKTLKNLSQQELQLLENKQILNKK